MHSDLIKRLEEAGGPSRELDAAIFAVTYPDKVPSPIVESGYGWRFDRTYWWLATGEDSRTPPRMVAPPAFTSSIDAAMTLVPELLAWHVSSACPHDACATIESGDDRSQDFTGKSHTPALAICIAALRAQGCE